MNKLIPLVVSAVIGFGGLSWAQEVPRTQDELAKLPIYKRVLDDTDSTNANELGKRYDEALSSENWEEARKCAQALLELRINKQGADHYEVIDARQLLDDLEILLKLTTEERSQLRDAARQEQQMGTLYREGQYAKAIEIGQQVLTTRKLLLGENHPAYADSLSYLGNQYLAIGDYPSAEKLYLQSDHFYRSLQRENHPDYAMNLSNMAVLYRSMGEYAKSESLYLRARDIRQQLLGEENAYLANSLSNLAILYDSMGAYAKAETLHFRARELRAKQYGENHLMYANSLNSIGLSYFNKGDYAKAEPLPGFFESQYFSNCLNKPWTYERVRWARTTRCMLKA